MTPNPIEPIAPQDLAAILALNNASAAETSLLALPDLERLVATAFVALRIGPADAFVIALDESAAYGSPNFLWFRQRFERFVYVDRIVTAAHARGRGLARQLYQRAISTAADAGHQRITCEVNLVPPNAASDGFHAALGFRELGRGTPYPGKTVRYLVRDQAAERSGTA